MLKCIYCLIVQLLFLQQAVTQYYSSYNFYLNRISTHLGHYPDIVGRDMLLSIKDDNIDSSSLDLMAKKKYFDLRSTDIVTNHATKMALLTTGSGFYSSLFRGVAPNADLHITSSRRLIPEFQNVLQTGAKLQLHPYGTGIENYYGLDASAYDAMMESDTSFLHIFSAGNSGVSSSNGGKFNGLIGWSNLTGNFKQSKNALVVGAIDEKGYLLDISSRGPTFDGRVKPEIVAFGEKGSSDAAAIVAGGVLLLQEMYKKYYGVFPSSALIKSSLIASAHPVDKKLLSFKSGYGNFDHVSAMSIIENKQYLYGKINKNQKQVFKLSIPDSISDIRFAISWIDPHADVGTTNILVNDIDFKVTDESGIAYMPLILSQESNQSQLEANPNVGIDRLNNTEFIYIENPKNNQLELVVDGEKMKTSTQNYYISYFFTKKNTFEWLQLTDSITYNNNELTIPWSTSYGGAAEFGYIDTLQTKRTIKQVDLSLNNQSFSFDYAGPAKFFMKIGGYEFVSKEYFLKKLPYIKQYLQSSGSIILEFANSLNAQIDLITLSDNKKIVREQNVKKFMQYACFTSVNRQLYWLKYRYNNYTIEAPPISMDTINRTSFFEKIIKYSENEGIQISLRPYMRELIDSVFLVKIAFSKNNPVDSIRIANNNLILYDKNPLPGLNTYNLNIKTKIHEKPFIEMFTYFHVPGDAPIIYPNPILNNDCFTLKFNEPALRVLHILTVQGKLLGEYKLEATENKICLPFLNDRFLVLQVSDSKSSHSNLVLIK